MRPMLLTVLLLAACDERPPPPPRPPDLAHAVVVTPPPPPPEPPLPPMAEVELSGKLQLPPGQSGEPHLYVVTDAECWKPGSRLLSDKAVQKNGLFTAEVIVKQNTIVWACAALVPRGAKPARPIWYGASDRGAMDGKGAGEVQFVNLTIALQKGAPVDLPKLK